MIKETSIEFTAKEVLRLKIDFFFLGMICTAIMTAIYLYLRFGWI